MASTSGSYEVKSAAHGPHWIAWVVRPGSDQPERSIVLVGSSQQEAEARARAWLASGYHPSS